MIVVDNTNYNTSHLARARSICRNYTVHVIDMHRDFGITLEQCIERNKNRKDKVPDVAIYAMNKKYSVIKKAKQPDHSRPFVSKKKYIVLDLDGTIADCKHRLKYICRQNSNSKDRHVFSLCFYRLHEAFFHQCE